MLAHVRKILHLGMKELYSLRGDRVLIFLIVYVFTFAIYSVATGVRTEVRNASIAVVDEDDSHLSRQIRSAFLRPYFQPAVKLNVNQIDEAMDSGRFAFVIDIPPKYQADVLAGRNPVLQLNVDATAMTLAGNGTLYIQDIINQEVAKFIFRGEAGGELPVSLVMRAKFNPNLDSSWFMAVMQIISNVTMLSLILSGAAVIREREHGTIEHLLVMPVTPAEIVLSKIWANGTVIVLATVISLYAVVQGVLGARINGSIALFTLGAAVFLFAMTALGITLSTVAKSMPHFGLLSIPFFVVMNVLSGGVTPLETMPAPLQAIMEVAPSTHFTNFSQAVLFRGAGLDIVWPQLAAMAVIGATLITIALGRFLMTMAAP